MQYSLAAILALVGSAVAQTEGYHNLFKPSPNEVLIANTDYTLEWKSGTPQGPVNFVLTGGETHALLQEIGTVASGIDSTLGKYTWKIDAALGDKKAYGLKIVLASDPTIFQWSNPFTIQAIADNKSSNAAAAVTTTSSSSSSSVISATVIVNSTSAAANLSTTATPTGTSGAATTILTQTTTSPQATRAATTTSSTPQATGGAAGLSLSSAAVIGGFFVAVMGL